MKNKQTSLVSVNWLLHNLTNPDIIILDATMKKTASGETIEQQSIFIPGAQPFNFDTEICDQDSTLPHMLCSVAEFEQAAKKLGINQNSKIIIYDAMGIFSSPRAWWMFKIMGHDNVYVLDGGLPKWLEDDFPVKNSLFHCIKSGNFNANFKPEWVSSSVQILDAIGDESIQIIDARSKQRFYAEEAEPRIGLRGGHIPGSFCLPYSDLIENGLFKNKQQLEEIFEQYKQQPEQLIFSCGSGVTACILALGASECDLDNWSVFDGSWSEWGGISDFPIEIA